MKLITVACAPTGALKAKKNQKEKKISIPPTKNKIVERATLVSPFCVRNFNCLLATAKPSMAPTSTPTSTAMAAKCTGT
jgi:hypothetical protein